MTSVMCANKLTIVAESQPAIQKAIGRDVYRDFKLDFQRMSPVSGLECMRPWQAMQAQLDAWGTSANIVPYQEQPFSVRKEGDFVLASWNFDTPWTPPTLLLDAVASIHPACQFDLRYRIDASDQAGILMHENGCRIVDVRHIAFQNAEIDDALITIQKERLSDDQAALLLLHIMEDRMANGRFPLGKGHVGLTSAMQLDVQGRDRLNVFLGKEFGRKASPSFVKNLSSDRQATIALLGAHFLKQCMDFREFAEPWLSWVRVNHPRANSETMRAFVQRLSGNESYDLVHAGMHQILTQGTRVPGMDH